MNVNIDFNTDTTFEHTTTTKRIFPIGLKNTPNVTIITIHSHFLLYTINYIIRST